MLPDRCAVKQFAIPLAVSINQLRQLSVVQMLICIHMRDQPLQGDADQRSMAEDSPEYSTTRKII